jgi:hypothetical protein
MQRPPYGVRCGLRAAVVFAMWWHALTMQRPPYRVLRDLHAADGADAVWTVAGVVVILLRLHPAQQQINLFAQFVRLGQPYT